MFYPAGGPRPAVDALNAQIKDWIELPVTKERFTQMAGYAAWSPPQQFATFVEQQIVRWQGLIEKEGLQLDVD